MQRISHFTAGDPWGIVERGGDEKGQSLLFVHSDQGREFLAKMKSLKLQPLSGKASAEVMGLGLCQVKEQEYQARPHNMSPFRRIKKMFGEYVLLFKAWFRS